jgi:prepilin-type N-terminal cleavage/methylation domain-containing protein
MLSHKQKGFTIVELVLVTSIVSIIVVLFYSVFVGSFNNFLAMQTDAVKFNDLSSQTQRIARIMRGATDVLEATPTSATVYAYFSPRDNVVSKVKYYVSGTQLKADITPMSSAPPVGTPQTAQMKSYVIIEKIDTSTSPFDYLDSAGNSLGTVSNLRDVKGMKITITVPPTKLATVKPTTLQVSVSLRNRKTNL